MSISRIVSRIAAALTQTIFSLIGLFAVSCDSSTSEPCAYTPDISSISINLHLEQLQDSVVRFTSKQALIDFFSRHTVLRDVFFNRPAYPDDTTFANELYRRFNHPGIDTLLQETRRVFGNLSELKHELTDAFAHIRYYYPNFVAPTIQTVITGLENDIYVSDTLIIIGLDFFLGSEAKYQPNVYRYILRRYQKNFIVPSIVLLFGIDKRYNKANPHDHTVLADMIAYGKAYYFAKQMVPCVPDSIIIGYSAEEISGSKKHSDLIWRRLIEDEVLYSTSHLIKQKYIAERPKTLEVGEKCPGRIATWVGWQIIKTHMEKRPNTTLPELMEKRNAKNVFNESAYRPN